MSSQNKSSRRFAVVTGGARGIGAAIGRMLLTEGYDVLATYTSDDDAAKDFLNLVHREFPETNVELVRADQSDYDDIIRLIDCLSSRPIDCIVFQCWHYITRAVSRH